MAQHLEESKSSFYLKMANIFAFERRRQPENVMQQTKNYDTKRENKPRPRRKKGQ